MFRGNGCVTLRKEKLTEPQALEYQEAILSKRCPWRGRRATCRRGAEGEAGSGPREGGGGLLDSLAGFAGADVPGRAVDTE